MTLLDRFKDKIHFSQMTTKPYNPLPFAVTHKMLLQKGFVTAGRCLEKGGKVRKTDSHKYMKVLLAFAKKATKYEPISSCVCGKSVRFLNARFVFIRMKGKGPV